MIRSFSIAQPPLWSKSDDESKVEAPVKSRPFSYVKKNGISKQQSNTKTYSKWGGVDKSPKKQVKHFLPSPEASAKSFVASPKKTTSNNDNAACLSPTWSRRISLPEQRSFVTPSSPFKSSFSRHSIAVPSPIKSPAKKVRISTVDFRSPTGVTDFLCSEDFISAPKVEWMNDVNLYSTPVFQKRLNGPATKIQTLVRGALARAAFRQFKNTTAAVKIQTVVRGFVQEQKWSRFVKDFKAARCIQKIARGVSVRQSLRYKQAAVLVQRYSRGYFARLHYQVLRLESVLAKVQSDHEHELKEIQEQKEAEMERFVKKAEKSLTKEQKEARNVHKNITEVRNNNRDLREQNSEIKRLHQEMAIQNYKCETATEQCLEHLETLKQSIKKLEADQKYLLDISSKFEERIQEATAALRRVDEMIAFEQSISSSYVNTIMVVVKHIDSKCGDRTLARAIQCSVQADLEKASGQTVVSSKSLTWV